MSSRGTTDNDPHPLNGATGCLSRSVEAGSQIEVLLRLSTDLVELLRDRAVVGLAEVLCNLVLSVAAR